MSDTKNSPMVIAAARKLCRNNSDICGVDFEDNWKIYGGDFIADAAGALDAAGVAELLQAAAYVAFSNGFDAALPEKMEALRAEIRKATGAAS